MRSLMISISLLCLKSFNSSEEKKITTFTSIKFVKFVKDQIIGEKFN
jgi:hypothetical protein